MVTLRTGPNKITYFHTDYKTTSRHVGTITNPLGVQLSDAKIDWDPALSPRGTGAPWLYNVYKIDNNNLIGFSHRESDTGYQSECTYAVGIMKSNDGGATWKYLADVIAPQNKLRNVGGVPYVVANGYVYVYFNDFTTSDNKRLSVARTPLSSLVSAVLNNTALPKFYKYAGGQWTQDGLTGLGDNIIPRGDAVDWNHDLHSDAVYSRALGKFLMTVQTHGLGKLMLYTSSDGVNWDNGRVLDETDNNDYIHAYSFFAGIENASDDGREVGSDFYVYFPRKNGDVYSADQLYRRRVIIDSNNAFLMQYNSADSFTANQQGVGRWYAYESTAAGVQSFKPMTWDAAGKQYKGSSTYSLIGDNWQHPDTNNDSVRVWNAPRSGVVRVRGKVRMFEGGNGDGVNVRIHNQQTQVWPASGWQYIGPKDLVGAEHDVSIMVTAGDSLHFVVNKNGNSDFDTTYWSPTVSYAYVATEGFDHGSPVQGANRWSYEERSGTTRTKMTWDETNLRWKGTSDYSLIGNRWQHPGSNSNSARVWTAPTAGAITVVSQPRKAAAGGDGVNIRILKNGTQVWPASGWKTIAANDTTGEVVRLNLSVAAGDEIAFEANNNGTPWHDTLLWNPSINY